MKLYEINGEIEAILDQCVDDETGEVNEDVFNRLLFLQGERETKLENTALYCKNITAEANAIREEEKTLRMRRERLERKAENVKAFLSRTLDGEVLKTAKVSCTFRSSIALKLDPEFTDWAKVDHDDLLRYSEPQPDKKEITARIKAGEEIPYARLEKRNNIQIA